MAVKKKSTALVRMTKKGGFKIAPPPKDARQRELLTGPDISANGGCRTVHHQAAR